VAETEEYGISTFVYRARRPFDPERFNAFVAATRPGLIRARGHFWLATRPDWVGDFTLAGAVAPVSAVGSWWSAVPRRRWPEPPEFRERLRTVWSEVWGDRRQELVFIGTGMDRAALTAALDACLVETRTEAGPFDPAPYRGLPDPSAAWRRAA
jgi:G3E family GTPase